MKKSFVKPDGLRHKIFKCFLPLLNDLEGLISPEKVVASRFKEVRNEGKFTYNIRGYDDSNRSVRMQVKYGGRMQEFVFVVAPEEFDKIKDFMSSYSIE